MIASALPSPTAVTIPDAQAPEMKTPDGDAGGSPAGRSAALCAWLGPKGERLADKAAEFNRYPTRYAHPSWMPDGWAPWVDRLAGRADSVAKGLEAKLGEGLLAEWELDARPCFDFAPPARRLVLMDAAPLRRTVLLAGLARHADEINRMMERGRVRELKEQVGEAAYLFVMHRAPLLAGPLTAGANAASRGRSWSARALAAGLGMLGACLGDHAGLAARVVVKFPRDFAPYLGAGGGQGTAEGYLRLFRKVLVKEVDPAWDDLLS